MRNIAVMFFLALVLISYIPGALACVHGSIKNNAKNDSQIVLNGQVTTVFFNDGDTFRVKGGMHKGMRVRIEGLNALESYGPVHQWGSFDEKELFDIAEEATAVAREGLWHCEVGKERDSYGRALGHCHDLAKSLIIEGLAHAYSINDQPALADYLVWQQKAIDKKTGMWRKGQPNAVVTSLHSSDENHGGYNRTISVSDGHSEIVKHKDVYSVCQKVCIEQSGSCMVYLPFSKRYGKDKPDCLRLEKNELR